MFLKVPNAVYDKNMKWTKKLYYKYEQLRVKAELE